MKTRFNTYDIICSVAELQGLIGMRVGQVYDIDHKTYLIKLQRSEEKCVLLLESGNRFHKTAFEWPKNVAPSGFSMKMRKHLKNKRLEVLKQVGLDRIVDLQFGTGEAAYHVFLELYDRGNIVLADHQLTILNILRQHSALEKIRFAVRETYPIGIARERNAPTVEEITEILKNSKNGEQLKKILNPHLVYGPAVIDHVLLKAGFQPNCKLGQTFNVEVDIPKLVEAINDAEKMIDEVVSQPPKGYIIQKKESRPKASGESEDFYTNQEFHPFLFEQCKSQPFKEFDNFNTAVDEFFSSLESQKIDVKAIHQEKEALKKLETVKKDHSERLSQLEKTQELDKQRAELITRNQALVDEAILVIRSAVANQVSWPDINDLVKSATAKEDPVASIIKQLKLDINHITLLLSDPFAEYDNLSEDDGDEDGEGQLKPMLIDIDLDLGAYANAKRYYDQKRLAAKKQQKTIESQGKALKSAERKTKQTLKEVQTITNISKARKIFWFEKFFWFISSENYLVIGGRDQQQNELVVKRYLRSTDIYVHADIHGASSIVILNPSGQEVPPKTLNEAGVMAVCYSAAWEAKVVTSAWWVHADQVSKTAPTGEYLTTGAFMIRGKKNYLPPCHLIMGFGFLFKLEESSIPRHKDERKVREVEDDAKAIVVETDNYVEEEIELSDDENHDKKDEDDKTADVKLENIEEENLKVEEEEEVEEKPELDEIKERGDEPHFPDTEIKIEHRTEELAYITSTTGTLSLSRNTSESDGGQLSTNKINIRPGGNKKDKTGNQKSSNKKNQKNKSRNNKNSGDGDDGFDDDDDDNDVNEDNQNETSKKQQQLKRGQRGKLKKIKEKYKDQDEEERKLIMEILQSAGSNKESKKNKKGSNKDQHDDKRNKKKGSMPNQYQKSQPPRPSSENQSDQVGNIDLDDSEPNQNVNVDVIDSLTGIPITEDELLFAVPVIAPYNTLQSYKYKIKMIPGTSKRGKAARAAVNVFIRDNAASSHEKDLLKSVKEQELFQNLPGKVKLVAPNLHKLKK